MSNYQYKIAETLDEKISAYKLIYQCYLDAGLISENQSKIYISAGHIQSNNIIFLAKNNEEVIGTLTAIYNNLPITLSFPKEVEKLKGRLVEASCLASKAKNKEIILLLIKILAQQTRSDGISQILIQVHPKYTSFYERIIGFRRFTQEKMHPEFNKPVIGLVLNFEEVDKNQPPCYNTVFGDYNV